jgi:hypothetical protein
MDGQIRADARLDQLTTSAAAVVAIEKAASGVEGALAGIAGVSDVRQEGADDGFIRYRVTAPKELALCPKIFDLARDRSWRLSELRQESKTLESVFRELAEKRGIAA